MNNNCETNYSKYYKQKITQKEPTLHTISVDFKNMTNTHYNKYNNNSKTKITNFCNNIKQINPKNNNKLFKNIKLYGVSKQTNFINKRNMKSKKINTIPYVSFTEINTNLKKTFSTHFKINNNNSTNFNNNTINLYHKNNYSNNNKNIIRTNKSLPKSKSNKIFVIPSQYYDIHSRNKNINNALFQSNSHSGYNKIYNNSNNKKLVNSKINKYI